MGRGVLGLWRAVGVTWVAMRVMLAGRVGTEGLGYGEDAGHLGGLYDDRGGGGGMATVGCRGGHGEGDGIAGEEHGRGGRDGRMFGVGGERGRIKNEDIDGRFWLIKRQPALEHFSFSARGTARLGAR